MALSLLHRYRSSIIWSAALIALFFMDAGPGAFSFCIPSLLGFEYCPGCGIGHAIHYALHLRFEQSIQSHYLGIPSVIAIIYLIIHPFFSLRKKANIPL